MFLVKFVVVTLTIYGVLCAKDNGEVAEDTEIREIREYSPETWRAVEGETIDMSGWIPQDSALASHEVPVLKRRRLRKRKRRPPHLSVSEENVDTAQERILYLPRRRLRPLRLDQSEEAWEDMEQENPKRSSNRRRILPSYNPEQTTEVEQEPDIITEKQLNINPLKAVIQFEDPSEETSKPTIAHEKIRDPFDALKEAEEKQKTPAEIKHTTIEPDLKALLKKSVGSISLSEILQQKNLTLSELLTGNVKAISVLTEPPESSESTEASEMSEATKYHRLPPSERKKMTNRVFEQSGESTESISSKELLEAQRKRLSLLHAHKDNKVYNGITHTYEIVTEPVTEKRIFVPSHPKHYTTISYKPILFQNTQKTPSTISTTQKYNITPQIMKEEIDNNSESSNTVLPPILPFKKLPITSAKLLTRLTTKMPITKHKVFTIPPKAIKINFEDVIRKQESEKPLAKPYDEPLKISLDLSVPMKSFEKIKPVSAESGDNTDIMNEKLKMATAREEIIEMLKDPIYRERLSRILQERNMTIEELVEQRERGSSQLHLADIFHNKTREPEPVDEPFVGVIKGELFDNHRKQKSREFEDKIPKVNQKGFAINAGTLNVETTQDEILLPVVSTTEEPSLSHRFGVSNNSFNYAAIMPFWKQFHPEVFNQFYQNGGTNNWNDLHRIEEVDNRLSDIVNDKLGVELRPKNYHLDEESFFDIPTGVKSALVASFAIVGLSLFLFLTILVIFKWTQRNKNKLNYAGSLSGVKIKSPILEMPHKNMFKSFVCETLGRKKNAYKSHLQSMSDVWDERKQKF